LAHTTKGASQPAGSNSLAIWEWTWHFVGEISVAKSGGTKENLSKIAFHRQHFLNSSEFRI